MKKTRLLYDIIDKGAHKILIWMRFVDGYTFMGSRKIKGVDSNVCD